MSRADNKNVSRVTPKSLTTTAIAAMAPGRLLADGAIRPGHGSLKARKRKTAGAPVVEWLFIWRRAGAATTLTLGRYSASKADGFLTIEQARDEARRLQALVRNGVDPAEQREINKSRARHEQSTAVGAVRDANLKTLSALLDAYVASLQHAGKDDTAYDVENIFSNHVKKAFPELADRPAAQIETEDVTRILSRLVGPSVAVKRGRTAVKLRSYMAAAFKLAIGASKDPMAPSAAADFTLTYNPAASVPSAKMAAAFNKLGSRVLSRDELKQYLACVAAHPSLVTRLALQLQVASAGQRIRQLLRLRHSEVDAHKLTLYDGKGRRSAPRAHVLPVIAEIGEVIEALRLINPPTQEEPNPYLFSSRSAALAAETLSAAVQQISIAMVAAGQSDTAFRGGDIRRTVETMLAETLRISKDTRAQLLSHGLTGVQDRVYDVGQHLGAKEAALRSWNDYLADLCIGSPTSAKVVAITSRAA